jgi:hypothetical protein
MPVQLPLTVAAWGGEDWIGLRWLPQAITKIGASWKTAA